ncbi:MAG: hypothetical protein L3J53_06390 [Proteobacteria bacterium]|nr:hypothetical protein [Pseudomonadota bacterium]
MKLITAILLLFVVQFNLFAKQNLLDVLSTQDTSKNLDKSVLKVIDEHNFEIEEGFSVGLLNGQNGWTTFEQSLVAPVIGTGNASSGDQHIILIKDPALDEGALVGGFSPDLGALPADDTSIVSIDIYISNVGGASYGFIAQAPSEAMLTWRVEFNASGTINILDDEGAGLVFVNTKTDWQESTYFNFKVNTNPEANTIEYYLDDTLIYTSVAGVFAASPVEQTIVLANNFQRDREFADFDNLKIDTDVMDISDLIFKNDFEN